MRSVAFVGFGILMFLAVLISPLHATTVRSLSLEEIVDYADRIFVGKVTEVREGKDEYGIAVTYITFSVHQNLKGKMPAEFTIKQLGRSGPRKGRGVLRIPGMPGYRKGEELVLFLYGTSEGGFTSPVGLGQGKFKVIRKGSEAFVVNERGRGRAKARSLYGMEKDPANPGLEMERFLSGVEERVRSPR